MQHRASARFLVPGMGLQLGRALNPCARGPEVLVVPSLLPVVIVAIFARVVHYAVPLG
jgi:hypothetical protein